MKLRVALKVSQNLWFTDRSVIYRLCTVRRAIRWWNQYTRRYERLTHYAARDYIQHYEQSAALQLKGRDV